MDVYGEWRQVVEANESLITSSSKLVGGENLATGPGRDGLEDAEADQLLDESDTTVGEQEVGATGMKRPVLVAMGEARGGVGPVSFTGVREDERATSFGVEARFGLERHQRNGRAGDQSNLRSSKRYAATNCPGLSSPPERGFARTPPWPRGSPGTPD